VLFLTGMMDSTSKKKGFQLGAVDYITKPFDFDEVRARVKTHLALKQAQESLRDQNALLERRVAERTQELEITQGVTIESLAALAETRDNETGGHIRRTQRYVRVLSERLSHLPAYRDCLTPENLQLIPRSAPLHDIGKVGVPDHILLKPGKLTKEEFERMKSHTIIGRDALLKAEAGLGTNSFLRIAREIAIAHHEKWNGTGYPAGLAGEEIPLPARIMALADVYDALISKRVYKPPFPHRKAIEHMMQDIGTHFDPAFGELLDNTHEELWAIAFEHADTEAEREALGKP
jgi:putative two-component system response regulator